MLCERLTLGQTKKESEDYKNIILYYIFSDEKNKGKKLNIVISLVRFFIHRKSLDK